MGKLTDAQIRNWIKEGERFEGRGDGSGLQLRYRKEDATPRWLFRYRLSGKPRILNLGANFTDVGPAFHRKAGHHFTHAGPVTVGAARR